MGIIKNDQIMWVSLGYLFYSLAYVTTNGVLFYLFKFVIGKPSEFWIAGAVATVIGFVDVTTISNLEPVYSTESALCTRSMLNDFSLYYLYCCADEFDLIDHRISPFQY